jgi:hypothetical protein
MAWGDADVLVAIAAGGGGLALGVWNRLVPPAEPVRWALGSSVVKNRVSFTNTGGRPAFDVELTFDDVLRTSDNLTFERVAPGGVFNVDVYRSWGQGPAVTITWREGLLKRRSTPFTSAVDV